MALFAEEVLDDLDSQGIVTKGVDGFFGHMPDTTGDVVALYDAGGQGSSQTPHAARSKVSVLCHVKGSTEASARTIADAIYGRWQGIREVDMGTQRVIVAMCNSRPARITVSEDDRPVFAFFAEFTIAPRPTSVPRTWTMLPDGDILVGWTSSRGSGGQYTRVNSGVSTPTDGSYISALMEGQTVPPM